MSNKNIFCPPYKTYNMISRPRTQTYAQWFTSPIYFNREEPYSATHGAYIKYFYDHILKILKTNHMNIKNEKQFRKEIATFIYRLSDENRECPP